jgi:hypothetical protein
MDGASKNGKKNKKSQKLSPSRLRSLLNVPNVDIKDRKSRLTEAIRSLTKLQRTAPSSAWIDAQDSSSDHIFPPGNGTPKEPHEQRMIMSTVSGRWTPPQCLTVEDSLDAMTPDEATAFTVIWQEVSPSALNISRWKEMNAR